MEKNNNLILILLAVLVLGGLGFYLVSQNAAKVDKADSRSTAMVADDTAVMEDETHGDTAMMEDKKLMQMEAPEEAVSYKFTEGSVSYTAQKRFLTKEDTEVVGTTTDVTGSGWYVAETGEIYLMANIDLVNLATDEESRDQDVLSMFDTPEAILVIDVEESSVVLNETFAIDLPGSLTVNGVTKDVTLAVEGTLTEDGFSATGATEFLISDFGIKPPSLLEVFTVDDELVLNFEVVGVVSN